MLDRASAVLRAGAFEQLEVVEDPNVVRGVPERDAPFDGELGRREAFVRGGGALDDADLERVEWRPGYGLPISAETQLKGAPVGCDPAQWTSRPKHPQRAAQAARRPAP